MANGRASHMFDNHTNLQGSQTGMRICRHFCTFDNHTNLQGSQTHRLHRRERFEV